MESGGQNSVASKKIKKHQEVSLEDVVDPTPAFTFSPFEKTFRSGDASLRRDSRKAERYKVTANPNSLTLTLSNPNSL